MEMNKTNNDTNVIPEIERGVSLLLIEIIAVFGNLLTVVVVTRYKFRRIPDILVLALACTDLVAAAFPIPMSTWLYFSTQAQSPLEACTGTVSSVCRGRAIHSLLCSPACNPAASRPVCVDFETDSIPLGALPSVFLRLRGNCVDFSAHSVADLPWGRDTSRR